MLMKTEAIKNYLTKMTLPDLAEKYSYEMECQVNVAQGNGTRVEGEYKGKHWNGFTDGLTTWKSFRIPWKASLVPEYNDSEMSFDLAAHAEGIGMTGWNWVKQCSQWVAFDFDAICGHSDKHTHKLSTEEIANVQRVATEIPWVTVRKSTSGQGLHLYVFLNNVPTENHTEHAALARAILGKMSALTGFDFTAKVDACGGNMWIWHRKMFGTDGLKIIKEGCVLEDVPPNWKDHVHVVSNRARKVPLSSADIDEIISQYPMLDLDEEHKQFIEEISKLKYVWWWDQDRHILITHTCALKEVHKTLSLRGQFDTLSDGSDPATQNCFLAPLRRGAWIVRRFTPGVQEHASWLQDGAGWTKCYLNREPDLLSACRSNGGVEDPGGGFNFQEAEVAMATSSALGATFTLPTYMHSRRTRLKQHKDGRLIVEITKESNDSPGDMKTWLDSKGKWIKIFNISPHIPSSLDVGNYDDLVRHLVTSANEDCGWLIKTTSEWQTEPLTHVKVALGASGYNNNEITGILGNCITKPWRLVNRPFQPEFPGDREWNRSSAQLRYIANPDIDSLRYGTWSLILEHCGKELDSAVRANKWCISNGITRGQDYLKCWIASLFQHPDEPLPYLFFYGPQNSGKSIFHEAISLLLLRGYKRADAALISQPGFNAELEYAVLCVVEEIDLRKNPSAYNRIKDWVTSREILIHAKGCTPYHIPNTLHFVQVANDHMACPVFSGDTRITMCCVGPLENIIPKRILIQQLEKEAPDFLASILSVELPEPNDRLNIPALETSDKLAVASQNRSTLELFIEEMLEPCEGNYIVFSDFYNEFIKTLTTEEIPRWSKIRVGRELPPKYTKGRLKFNNSVVIGNAKWVHSTVSPSRKLVLVGETLE